MATDYVCDCKCHTTRGMMHCVPCCYPCKECNKDIESGRMERHIMSSHAPQILEELEDKK